MASIGVGNRLMSWCFVVPMMMVLFISCAGTTQKSASEQEDTSIEAVNSVQFSADSAYQYTVSQVEFGPRVLNTEAHKKCGDYLVSKLEAHGAKVYQQEATLKAFDGVMLNMRNIIGVYNADKSTRILLCAHWDSRPWADNEMDEKLRMKPIDGANDGASGVGVLLEIARQLSVNLPHVGVDIVLFDAEDRGAPQWVENSSSDDWCLGSQYWSKTPHVPNYTASFGILLDMVGAKDAYFALEYYSTQYAGFVVDKVWTKAQQVGAGKYFRYEKGSGVLDDHYYVNTVANIPCIDVIHYEPTSESHFGHYWHTHADNISAVDKNTLKAVGQTLLKVIYDER